MKHQRQPALVGYLRISLTQLQKKFPGTNIKEPRIKHICPLTPLEMNTASIIMIV